MAILRDTIIKGKFYVEGGGNSLMKWLLQTWVNGYLNIMM